MADLVWDQGSWDTDYWAPSFPESVTKMVNIKYDISEWITKLMQLKYTVWNEIYKNLVIPYLIWLKVE